MRNTVTTPNAPGRVEIQYQHLSFVLGKYRALAVGHRPSHVGERRISRRRHWIGSVGWWIGYHRRAVRSDGSIFTASRHQQSKKNYPDNLLNPVRKLHRIDRIFRINRMGHAKSRSRTRLWGADDLDPVARARRAHDTRPRPIGRGLPA